MRLPPNNRLAAILLGASAAASLSVWYIMIFVAVPERHTVLEHATELLPYLLMEFEPSWPFWIWAVLPVLLMCAAVTAWRCDAQPWCLLGATLFVGLCAALAAFVMLPLALWLGVSAYLLSTQWWLSRRSSGPPSAATELQR